MSLEADSMPDWEKNETQAMRGRHTKIHQQSVVWLVLLLVLGSSQIAPSGFCVSPGTPTAATSTSSPYDLRCEYAESPLGVDALKPRLSWKLKSAQRGSKQSGYHVLVASSTETLEAGQGDLWDSGMVDSDRTLHVEYAGKKLENSQQVFWKVRTWDQNSTPSEWSEPATWTTGVIENNGWQGQWIVAPWSSESLMLRKAFAAKHGVKRALLHVCGLGQHVVSINGRAASDNLLSPGWSKYDRTCLYETLDVTNLVQSGDNAIGVILGDGMYNTERRNRFSKFQGTFGPLRLMAQLRLEYADGSHQIVASDDTWRVSRGPVTYNDIFGGEDYDARLLESGWDEANFDDSHWQQAVVLVRPRGRLRGFSSSAPPLQSIESIAPKSVNTLNESTKVIDFGQNASFIPKLTVSGPAGSTVRLTHAEVLHEDGAINRGTCGGNRGPAYWQYTKSSDAIETWFPQFFYAGCRYMQLDRIPAEAGGTLPSLEKVEAHVVHSTAAAKGHFECSNDLINRIRGLVRWAQRSNMVSVLTDCPHREKLGWLEQYHLNGPAIRYEFDVDRVFIKSMRDMADSQHSSGLVPNIAPEYVKFPGTFQAAAEWGSAVILVPWQQYQFTGDISLLREYYKEMQRYVDYLGSKAEDHLVSEGLGDWYDLGPADRPGHAQLTLPPVTATAFYYIDAKLMSQIAALIGKQEDSQRYEDLAQQIRSAWITKFHNDDGTYASNSQCANALALEMGLAKPEDRSEVLAALVQDIKNNGNATTAGDVGHRFVLLALANNGYSDLIYKMINQDERPGYGYQLKKGATSLTEAWDANHRASHNHFMLGHITEWLYGHLLGIKPDPEQPGFKNVIISPTPVGDLKWAEGSYESVHGPIKVRWERNDSQFTLDMSIPAGSTATLYLPVAGDAEITEGDSQLGSIQGIREVARQDGKTVIQVGSGSYSFVAKSGK